jgi:hypothetical protein
MHPRSKSILLRDHCIAYHLYTVHTSPTFRNRFRQVKEFPTSSKRSAMTSKPTSSNSETDAIMTALFAREDLPPLEPGTHVYSAELRDRIRGLQGREHKFVLAGASL